MIQWLYPVYPIEITYRQKILFLGTNSLYILPNLGKFDRGSGIMLGIGTISTIYHVIQCFYSHCLCTKYYYLEVLLNTLLTGILIFNRKTDPNKWWYLLFIPTILCFVYGNKNRSAKMYTLLHGGWHILSSILLLAIK